MNTELILDSIGKYGWAIILCLFSMIEISPIKINPWSAILECIGNKLNGELAKDIKEVKEEVQTVKEQVGSLDKRIETIKDNSEMVEVKQSRVRILRFDDELLQGHELTKDHFRQTLEDIDIYEDYCRKHEDFRNGIAVHAIKHIKDTYDTWEKTGKFNQQY